MPIPKPKTQPLTIASTEQPRAPSAGVLLTPAELAERLRVAESWVREKTRGRARVRDKDPLPVVRLGKYVRFNWSEVEKWIARQGA
jgi:excisionase family DNA binding protein